MLKHLLEKRPASRFKVEEALNHPWIMERVKIRALKSKRTLYSHIDPNDERRCENILERVRDKLEDRPCSEQKSLQGQDLLLPNSSF
jgi:hypothetical protein